MYRRIINKRQMNEYTKIKEKAMTDSIVNLSNVLSEKDSYTFEHCKRVSYYSFLIGKTLGLPYEELTELVTGALFHDMGKIAISDSILNKTGKLSESERETMRIHPKASAELLKMMGCSKESITSMLYHHECYDGTGYPFGLKGNNIPLLSRIISVADTYDAMTTKRSYSKRMDSEEALEKISHCKGSQFDPKITDVFINMMQIPQRQLQTAS